MVYSYSPIFSVPAGVVRFCAASALATSRPVKPRDCNAAGARSKMTFRALPANGQGGARALYRDQARAHEIHTQIGEILLGQPPARQRELDDRHRRGTVIDDQ